jgi:RNA polymerase sigma-70 factor (ECF subfamily)
LGAVHPPSRLPSHADGQRPTQSSSAATSRPGLGPDDDVFAALYREHAASVHAAAFRVLGRHGEAEDITQETFLRYWRDPGRFDPARGELGSYLRVMARSRALDLWRQEQAAGRARDRLKLVERDEEVRTDERPAAAAEREEARRRIRAALRKLPAKQREALVLSYWGSLTSDEIARRAGVPFGTARSRMRLGIEKLRRDLAGEPDAA